MDMGLVKFMKLSVKTACPTLIRIMNNQDIPMVIIISKFVENNNKKAKILIKTPIAMQNNQKSSNSLILDQGTKKIENTDGGQSKRASVKLTNSKNYNIKSSSEAFIGLQNTNNSHGMIHVVSDIRPTSSEYPVKSHLPVVHNYVIQFDQNTLVSHYLSSIESNRAQGE